VNPKAYGRIFGAVLLLVGVAGFFQNDLLGMDLSKRHSAVHLASGALLLVLGLSSASASLTKNVVLAIGVVYLLLGVCGFFVEQILPGFRIFHTDLVTNVIHLAIGLAGVAAAMMGGAKAAPVAA
jgi:Domain of unknown function (DUF4383)